MDRHYTVLARRFRPQTFGEVVGQERVATTLRNAILEGRVAHAYLFTGARGVGKTSMARIFAKSLNCPNAKDAAPCNACEQCQAISAGQDVDVSEIDGASNRGIDDIRLLRANVNVRSMRSRFKVYIIDEVHMLTKEAFNALLKTLEEPPPAVKFIFCTTEPRKVPDTILSRCQRFDFGTIATESISERLSQIAEAEGIEADRAAIDLVARRAGGSMRDSQSLFDQVLAGVSGRLTIEEVHRLLGTAPDDRLYEIIDALLNQRRDEALRLFAESLANGIQLDTLADQLVVYLRDVMVLAAGAADSPLLGIDNAFRGKLQEQANRLGLRNSVAALQILGDARGRMQRVGFGRALFEVALIRLSMLDDLRDIEQLISEVSAVAGTSRDGEKKNDAPPVAPPAAAAAPPRQAAPLPFAESSLTRIRSELLLSNGDTDLRALAKANLAICGPNQLDILFPAGYDFREEVWTRPEVTNRVQQVVRELTGVTPEVTVRQEQPAATAVTAPPAKKPAKPPAAEERFGRAGDIDQIDDPLVRKAVELFGVTNWKRTERQIVPSAEEAETEHV